jgi:hypothetical protein
VEGCSFPFSGPLPASLYLLGGLTGSAIKANSTKVTSRLSSTVRVPSKSILYPLLRAEYPTMNPFLLQSLNFPRCSGGTDAYGVCLFNVDCGMLCMW